MSEKKIKIAVNGAGGRMGQRIVALAHADPALAVACAVENKNSPTQGRDAGEVAGIGVIDVRIQRQLDGPVDVVIDFSTPEGLVAVSQLCSERQIPLVAATTGLT
jgi:4-hydroxy-tetrahydrodipicolinate reductase